MKRKFTLGFLLPVILSVTAMAQKPDSGLVLHYSALTPGQDLSGYDNHGEWHSIETGAGIPGVAAKSMSFDGSSSNIRVSPSPALAGCKSITVAVWFNPHAFPSSTSRSSIIHQWFPDQYASWELAFFFDAIQFVLTDGKTRKGISAAGFLQKNTWHHIAGVFDFDKQEMRLYLNGLLKDKQKKELAPVISPHAPLYIGGQNFNGQVSHLFPCELEDFRIYNRALAESEVRALTEGFVFPKPEAVFQKIEQLEAGRYIISSVDADLKYAGIREIVQITPGEPFWKKSWFVACSIAAAFLISFGIAALYYHFRQQEQAFEFEKRQLLERERYRVARQMHDDIGSGLSAINLLTEIALNKSKDPQLAAEIERIAAAAREVNGRIQDIIWAISTQNDTIGGLQEHLQRLATDMLAPAGILIHLQHSTDMQDTPVSSARRRALFLAFKEALHNIVKHAHATQVSLQFEPQGRQLCVRLCDNGCGFDPATTGDRGNGLMNMQRRMEEVGGKFHIRSGASGTTVDFILTF